MADGELLVARITYNFKTDEKSYQWIQDRLTREILVLKLLKHLDQTLPVPQIYVWDFDPSNSVDAPFSVMERLYGEDQWSAWPKLTSEEKIKFVQSLAEAMGRIFKISMPSIGSLEKLTNENHPIVGPFVRIPSDPRTGGPYATIDEYLAAELQPWRADDQSEYEFSVPELFERLHVLARRLVPRDDPTMLRPVLFHNDLDVRNVMANDGIVSGIIDWEYHAALPACLAAVYPKFMRFDGIFDPKYDIERRIMPTKESWATASEAGPLRRQDEYRWTMCAPWILERTFADF
ncbi:kinase-like domain-containing protein [Gautieria morchelliformis]|nr:kinase-like domain-containing protein [Gautieria morchelliformis]